MNSRFLRAATAGLTIVSMLAAATPSQAFFGLFQPRYTTAAPPTYPAYCGACPQTVQYVPQTCFRTQTTSVPVTTLRPVNVIDPCTGCVQTIVQPTTSIVQQVRFIPYQSFRIVQRPTVVAAPIATTVQFAPQCATTCGTTTSFAAAPVVAASGCSTCGVSAATFTTPVMSAPLSASPIGSTLPQIPTAVAPSLSTGATYSVPGSATTTYGSVPSIGPATPAPSLSPIVVPSPTTSNGTTTITQSPVIATTPSTSTLSPSTSGTTIIGPTTTTVPATLTPGAATPTTPAPAATETKSPVTPAPNTKLVPIPDLRFTPDAKPSTDAAKPTTSTPGLVDPNSRTTMLPAARPWSSTLVSWPTRPAATVDAASKVEPAVAPTASDWRPSNR